MYDCTATKYTVMPGTKQLNQQLTVPEPITRFPWTNNSLSQNQ